MWKHVKCGKLVPDSFKIAKITPILKYGGNKSIIEQSQFYLYHLKDYREAHG